MKLLIDHLRAQADWREKKAAEYPEDERNARSAAALASLADYVEAGADGAESWTLTILEEQADIWGGAGVADFGEQASREISRYGFGYSVTDATHAAFLDELAPIALADTYDLVRDSRRSYEGCGEAKLIELIEHYGLNPWEIEAAIGGVDLDSRYFARSRRMTPDEQKAWIEAVRVEQDEWNAAHGIEQDR